MSNELATATQLDEASLLALVTSGDCKRLSPQQKMAYYHARCEAAGLDPRTAPFQFLTLQGREILYALKSATDQLAAKHGIRCEIMDQRTEDGPTGPIRTVTVRALTSDGRATDEIGAVSMVYPDRVKDRNGNWVAHPKAGKPFDGDDLCNALMKAVTKAKRRAVLAVCGLGMLDETELETITGAAPAAPERVVKMPTRLSARAAAASAAPEGEAQAAKPEPPSSPEPDGGDYTKPFTREEIDAITDAAYVGGEPADETTEQLQASLAPIDESQRRALFSAMRAGGHSKEQVSAYLARRGIKSSKDVPVAMFKALRERLENPAPLSADAEA